MKLLTAQDTAVILRVTPHRVYQMAREGLLPSIRVGRCLRIDEARLQTWLDGGGLGLPPSNGKSNLTVDELESLPMANGRNS